MQSLNEKVQLYFGKVQTKCVKPVSKNLNLKSHNLIMAPKNKKVVEKKKKSEDEDDEKEEEEDNDEEIPPCIF